MIKSIYRFLILQLNLIYLDLSHAEQMRPRQVPVCLIRIRLHVERYLVGVFGPLGAAEVAPVVIACVAVLADAEVPEAEGEEVVPLAAEVLHRVELVVAALTLQVLRAVRHRKEERPVVIEILRV